MARRRKPEEHANHERWLVSYADFITLLFAFFVVMFATSQSDHGKAARVSESVRKALEEGQVKVVQWPSFWEARGTTRAREMP